MSFYVIFNVLETLSFYDTFLVPEDFECLRYFPGSGYFDFERKMHILGLFPVVDTLSLSEKSFYWDFFGIGDFEFEQKISAHIILSSANDCSKTY